MQEPQHRIAYALYISNVFAGGKNLIDILDAESFEVTPEEYDPSMKGKIYCPVCSTPLARTPETEAIIKNNRTAHFKHKPSDPQIPCRLRTTVKGFNYRNEREAQQAIENKELVIVSGWAENPPDIEDELDSSGNFVQTAIEDEAGPVTEVSIARHIGQPFNLPSVISTVAALCKNFSENLHKGYHFPNSNHPQLLSNALVDVNRIEKGSSGGFRLFFGKIASYKELTKRTVIELEHTNLGVFKLYSWPYHDQRKRIDQNCVGRFVLFYANLQWESASTPRSFLENWGEYALLPVKYERFLIPLFASSILY